MKINSIISILALLAMAASCQSGKHVDAKDNITKEGALDFMRNAIMYEVNLRQHTPKGTIQAFSKQLDSLKLLGVDVLWFMPVQPIGVLNRKGNLGSYYSIKDYTAVNPEFGTSKDFKALVALCHEKGFKVLLDWVANHSAFDNPWAINHPDWYIRDSNGNILPPIADWSDVADLNYESEEMRWAMINAMKYWVQEFDIDGFRCDVASMVPTDFWKQARTSLDSIKPLFMLAEAEEHDMGIYEGCFNAYYGWELHHIMNQVAAGKKNPTAFDTVYHKKKKAFQDSILSMNFITNHDENSWNGTIFERMPEAWKAMAALSYTWPGIPLMYSGQEKGLNKRLRFFDKDTIHTNNESASIFSFYQSLNALKKQPALGIDEGSNNLHNINATSAVLTFERHSDEQKIKITINMSDEPHHLEVTPPKKAVLLSSGLNNNQLAPWGFVIHEFH